MIHAMARLFRNTGRKSNSALLGDVRRGNVPDMMVAAMTNAMAAVAAPNRNAAGAPTSATRDTEHGEHVQPMEAEGRAGHCIFTDEAPRAGDMDIGFAFL